ncbi:hypothetical protein QOZ95_005512 [Paenibacillus brasilensis]|uniref:Uncharacterized protein n=1 Tax=Paenibacillus brasilensis TaxID=128574 RepID=A0ABU0L7L3_9BACL|nr:hypothetical protein [Paenibacillus brasilensis]
MPPVPGFVFQSSAPFLAVRALLIDYALPPLRGALGTLTRLNDALPSAQK